MEDTTCLPGRSMISLVNIQALTRSFRNIVCSVRSREGICLCQCSSKLLVYRLALLHSNLQAPTTPLESTSSHHLRSRLDHLWLLLVSDSSLLYMIDADDLLQCHHEIVRPFHIT